MLYKAEIDVYDKSSTDEGFSPYVSLKCDHFLFDVFSGAVLS